MRAGGGGGGERRKKSFILSYRYKEVSAEIKKNSNKIFSHYAI